VRKNLSVQAFIPQLPVEAFAVAVLGDSDEVL